MGHRLEYFFWRVLSSRAYQRLPGREVARLFAGISQGDIIRTTPRSSPRSSRAFWSSSRSLLGEPTEHFNESSPTVGGQPLRTPVREAQVSEALNDPRDCRKPTAEQEASLGQGIAVQSSNQPGINVAAASEVASTQTQSSATGADSGRARPHKTFGQDNPSDDRTRLLSSTQRSCAAKSSFRRASGASNTLQAAVNMERQGSSDSATKSTRRKAPVIASSSNRRRPVVARRKSSQSSTAGVVEAATQSSRGRQSSVSQALQEEDSATHFGPPLEGTGLDLREIFPPMVIPRQAWPISRSASPVSRSPLKAPAGEGLAYRLASDPPEFAEQRKARQAHEPIASRPSLLGLAALKSAPALGPASFQAGGRIADGGSEVVGQGREAIETSSKSSTNDIAAPQQQRNSNTSRLPRSRSHLTELIGKGRGRTG